MLYCSLTRIFSDLYANLHENCDVKRKKNQKVLVSWADYQADYLDHSHKGHLNPVFFDKAVLPLPMDSRRISGHEEMMALVTISAPMDPLQVEFGWWSQRLAVADDAEVQEMHMAYLGHSVCVWDEAPDKDAEFLQAEPSNCIINNQRGGADIYLLKYP